MKSLLLTKLKLATRVPSDYISIAKSTVFPEYTLCIAESDKVAVFGDGVANETTLMATLGCVTQASFEATLYAGFKDKQDILLRFTLLIQESCANDWVPIQMPAQPESVGVEQSTNVCGITSDTDTRAKVAPLTLAEYDAVIDYLKTVTVMETNARKNIMTASILAMKDLNDKRSAVVDVLFDNLVVALQMSKNVNPLESRQFLAKLMDTYITITDAEGN